MKPKWPTSIFEGARQTRSRLSIYWAKVRLSSPRCQKTYPKTTRHSSTKTILSRAKSNMIMYHAPRWKVKYRVLVFGIKANCFSVSERRYIAYVAYMLMTWMTRASNVYRKWLFDLWKATVRGTAGLLYYLFSSQRALLFWQLGSHNFKISSLSAGSCKVYLTHFAQLIKFL